MDTDLPERARKALDRARAKPMSYVARVLRTRDGRVLVVLGEAHVKLALASEIGRDVVGAFELRGVETFQRKAVFLGRLLGFLIQAPRTLLRVVSLGAVKGSTITDAKQLPSGHTVELERSKHVPFGLHVASAYLTTFLLVSLLAVLAPLYAPFLPWLAAAVVLVALAFEAHMVLLVPAILLRRYRWCWMIHPLLGILVLRDELMAAGTITMLEDHPREHAVVVMGRAHVPGYTRLLEQRGLKPERST